MRITMLVESLSSGGAERQMCYLAAEMHRRGHDVQVITYAPGDFYAPLLEQAGVTHVFLGGVGSFQWLIRVRRFLRTNKQDVVLAFLEGCASYAELAALPFHRWGLVVSERSAFPRLPNFKNRFRKMFHLIADAVTTNSHTNRLMLEAAVPALKSKVVTIYNAVDLSRFKPGAHVSTAGQVRLVVAARFNEQKNVLRTIEAVALARNLCKGITVSVDWFGNAEDSPWLWKRCMDLIKKRGLERCFHIYEPTRDIISQYQRADAVLLPSLYEGLPNTVCEAMACGRPVLMSAVCDAGNLVNDGKNGFLFSPEDPSDIANAIYKFASLPEPERRAMGKRSREMAENIFDIRKFADRYEKILIAASRRQGLDCGHWMQNVPQTALDYVKQATVF